MIKNKTNTAGRAPVLGCANWAMGWPRRYDAGALNLASVSPAFSVF